MKKSILFPAALLVALLGAIYFYLSPNRPPRESSVVAPVATPAAEPAPSEPLFPLAPIPAPEETVAGSEAESAPPEALEAEAPEAVTARLIALLKGQARGSELLIFDHLIPRLVVTIDNLPSKELPRKQLPVKGAEGLFLTQEAGADERINPYNARRYTPFVEFADALDSRELVDLYVRLYPEFQKAYEDLGQPKAYFNDRLIAVIDHLLATPEPAEPILLKRPKVLHQYADPDLEGRSAGQKILLRVGADNRARLKAKLQGIRAELLTRVDVGKTEKTEP